MLMRPVGLGSRKGLDWFMPSYTHEIKPAVGPIRSLVKSTQCLITRLAQAVMLVEASAGW